MGDGAVDPLVVVLLDGGNYSDHDDLFMGLDIRGQRSEELENEFQNDHVFVPSELLLAKDMAATVDFSIGKTQNTILVMFLRIEIQNIIVPSDTKHGDGIHVIVLGGNRKVLETEIGMTVPVYKEHCLE